VLVGRDRITGWTAPARHLADAFGRWRPRRPLPPAGSAEQ
jgi:hypothetical protein